MIFSLKTWSSQRQMTLIVEARSSFHGLDRGNAAFIPAVSFEWSSLDAGLRLLCEKCSYWLYGRRRFPILLVSATSSMRARRDRTAERILPKPKVTRQVWNV